MVTPLITHPNAQRFLCGEISSPAIACPWWRQCNGYTRVVLAQPHTPHWQIFLSIFQHSDIFLGIFFFSFSLSRFSQGWNENLKYATQQLVVLTLVYKYDEKIPFRWFFFCFNLQLSSSTFFSLFLFFFSHHARQPCQIYDSKISCMQSLNNIYWSNFYLFAERLNVQELSRHRREKNYSRYQLLFTHTSTCSLNVQLLNDVSEIIKPEWIAPIFYIIVSTLIRDEQILYNEPKSR